MRAESTPRGLHRGGVTAAALARAALAGCAPLSERVVLLPQADGRPSAVEASAQGQMLLLTQPYSVAELRGGKLTPVSTDAAAVQLAYGALLAVQPARPRGYTVQFESHANRLMAGAEPVLAETRSAERLRAAAARWRPGARGMPAALVLGWTTPSMPPMQWPPRWPCKPGCRPSTPTWRPTAGRRWH